MFAFLWGILPAKGLLFIYFSFGMKTTVHMPRHVTEVSVFIVHGRQKILSTPTVQHLPLNWARGENTKHLAMSVRECIQCLQKNLASLPAL